VHRHLRLPGRAHAIALDGARKDDRGLAPGFIGRMKGRVDLLRVVAAVAQRPDVVVAHVLDHLEQARIAAEEMLADIGAILRAEGLIVAVQRIHHHLLEDAVLVARQQRIPAAAPQALDDIPARAAKLPFQLLDDLAVAAHRAIEALQVAVDDEDQIIEMLARGQVDRALALGLVHLAVTQEHPDLAPFGVGDAACVQVLEKARLVDRHVRPQPHGDRGKLPEVGHEPGVRVARQAGLVTDLLAKVQHLIFGNAPFHEGARIHARRAVALQVDAVAAVLGRFCVPEMVEAGLEHRRDRRVRADVPAERAAVVRMDAVGARHHDHGVPAHVGAQALFDLDVAGAALLFVRFKGVHIARRGRERHVDGMLARVLQQLFQKKVSAFGAFFFDDRGQRVHPFVRFLFIGVRARLAMDGVTHLQSP